MADNTHCSIVGFLGILIQIILGILSFSVLIIKRHYEDPKRPWKVWCYDTLKQGISQLLAHFLNLLISLILTDQDPNSDTCLWYFITNIFDNTAGVFISVMILRKIEKKFLKKNKTHLVSGFYYDIKEQKQQVKHQIEGEPVQISDQVELSAKKTVIINHRAWLLQLGLWNSVFILSKFIVFLSQFFLRDLLDALSHFLLGWIQQYPNFELIMVMVIVPVIMNGFAFWMVDNFLKKRDITQQVQQLVQQQELEKQQEGLQKNKAPIMVQKQSEQQFGATNKLEEKSIPC